MSQSEKEDKRAKKLFQVENKEMIQELQSMGVETNVDVKDIPETPEEAEIFMDANIKTAAEIAAQVGTNMTLEWNDFDQRVYRRAVNDLVACGMAVVKEITTLTMGLPKSILTQRFSSIVTQKTQHSQTSSMLVILKKLSISELRRIVGDEFTEEQFEKIAQKVKNKYQNRADKLSYKYYDETLDRTTYGYDEFIVEVMDFEFISTDQIYFEGKKSRFGNESFHYKGFEYNAPKQSVYERKPYTMDIQTVFGGSYVVGCDYTFGYGQKSNIPKNAHDLTKARLSYSVVATNLRRMMPKSLVGSVIGFADQLQLSHLKLQQAIAKAKPDGLIVDVEGLENVQLGKGGELQPLDIQDIYEQTGVFYYRSKNPEGGFQNPPVRSLDNSIRNINELISIYNHNLRLIRDTTGINEVMDGTSPKGEQLVGVRQQAIAAGNNAIYDISNSALYLYTKVCEDIVKCLQILPSKSVIFKAYEQAIGKSNMKVLASFGDLPMYNFGIKIQMEMDDTEKAYLEQTFKLL